MTFKSYSSNRVESIKDRLKSLIPTYFGSTLDRETDIVNIVSGLIYRESRFNVNSVGPIVSTNRGSSGYSYLSSPAIQSKLISGNPTEQANINQGVRAIGLMQVMGWNMVRGGAQTGICEIQRLRPDLASSLLVNPGEDIFTQFLGEANIDKALLAGLIILEGKYKATLPNGSTFYVKGDPYSRIFISKMQGAVAAYLGLGKSDNLGTTPFEYAQSIIGGDAYIAANGKNKIKISDSNPMIVSSAGPSTNGSSRPLAGEPGCNPKKA